MRNPLQLEICFPSMDNPAKGAMRVGDIAKTLNCSEDHVRNLLLDGTIRAGDISRDGSRQHLRVPREEWQRYYPRHYKRLLRRPASAWRSTLI